MAKFFFKRKRYGYGWKPVTTEGWLIVAGFVIVVLLWSHFALPQTDTPSTSQDLQYGIGLFALVTVLLLVTRRYAPPAKWRWGKKDDDNLDEDC